jgi:hypothetical protein
MAAQATNDAVQILMTTEKRAKLRNPSQKPMLPNRVGL